MPETSLAYKHNWPEARRRLEAFWQGEIIDRACVSVMVPTEEQCPLPEDPDPEVQMTDIELHLARINTWFGNYHYLGESVPEQGSIIGYTVFGGEPEFIRDGSMTGNIWVHPTIVDYEDTPYKFDPQNKWCQLYLDLKRREYDDSRGKYLPALAGTLPPTDTLSFLRGPQSLCMDLMEYAGQVKDTQRKLLAAYKWLNGERFKIINAAEEGTASLNIWAPGRYLHLTCDFCCMISPRQFREFVMPELEDLTRWLDHSLFHLDGPNAHHQIPGLLELEQLGGIQFQRVTGHENVSFMEWLPALKEVQAAGKSLHLSGSSAELEALLQELDPRGIFFHTGARTVEEAEALLLNVERWSRKGLISVAKGAASTGRSLTRHPAKIH